MNCDVAAGRAGPSALTPPRPRAQNALVTLALLSSASASALKPATKVQPALRLRGGGDSVGPLVLSVSAASAISTGALMYVGKNDLASVNGRFRTPRPGPRALADGPSPQSEASGRADVPFRRSSCGSTSTSGRLTSSSPRRASAGASARSSPSARARSASRATASSTSCRWRSSSSPTSRHARPRPYPAGASTARKRGADPRQVGAPISANLLPGLLTAAYAYIGFVE